MNRLLLLLVLPLTAFALSAAVPNWPQFRGPNASGVSEDARPPVHFGPESNQLWKVTVPRGISSPVTWGNHLFLTALADSKLLTLAYDVRDGRELWRQIAPAEKIEPCHEFSSPAASTPCTDGERVYVCFGSFGLLAYDFSGKEAWRRPFERLPSQYGTAIAGNRIYVRGGDHLWAFGQ